ncbi:hypothetical protein REPUB_Repub16aG0063700 [Reevesia pubescens]
MRLVGWFPLAPGIVRLNTDGASLENPGIAGAGGLIRTSMGEWSVGFRAHLGVCSNVAAELQAVRFGLLLAWNEGFRHIECQIDAKVIIDLINDANSNLHPLGILIEDIRMLKARSWVCHIIHTLREGNFCADALAKSACDIELDFEILRSPPSFVVPLLTADSRGIMFPRGFKMY